MVKYGDKDLTFYFHTKKEARTFVKKLREDYNTSFKFVTKEKSR